MKIATLRVIVISMLRWAVNGVVVMALSATMTTLVERTKLAWTVLWTCACLMVTGLTLLVVGVFGVMLGLGAGDACCVWSERISPLVFLQ